MKTGELIRKYRKEAGLNGKDCAEIFSVDLSQYYRYERGLYYPSMRQIEKLAAAVHCDAVNLIGEDYPQAKRNVEEAKNVVEVPNVLEDPAAEASETIRKLRERVKYLDGIIEDKDRKIDELMESRESEEDLKKVISEYEQTIKKQSEQISIMKSQMNVIKKSIAKFLAVLMEF